MGIEFDPEAMAAALAQAFGLYQQEFMRKGIEKRETARQIETEKRAEKRLVAGEGRREKKKIAGEERQFEKAESLRRRARIYAFDMAKINTDLQIGAAQKMNELNVTTQRANAEWTAQFQHDLSLHFGNPRFKQLMEKLGTSDIPYEQQRFAALDKHIQTFLSGTPLTADEMKAFPQDTRSILTLKSRELADKNRMDKLNEQYKSLLIQKTRSEIDENNAQALALTEASGDPTKIIDATEKVINSHMKELLRIRESDSYLVFTNAIQSATPENQYGTLSPQQIPAYESQKAIINWYSRSINEKTQRVRQLKYMTLTEEQRDTLDKLQEEQLVAADLAKEQAQAEATADQPGTFETSAFEAKELLESAIADISSIADPAAEAIDTVEDIRGAVSKKIAWKIMPKILTTKWKKKYKKDILTHEEMTDLREQGTLEEGTLFTAFDPNLPDEQQGLFRVVINEKGALSAVQIERVGGKTKKATKALGVLREY